jgi:hypothetical protein
LGLLDRAKSMLQGRPAAPTSRSQYYRVACVEGHVLHGQRTEGYQALRCPVCNEGIFVLPRSPLPEPLAPASAKAPAPRQTSMGFGDELILADPPSPAEIAEARAAQPRPRPQALPPGEAEPEAEIEWVDDVEPAGPATPADPPPRKPKPAKPKPVPAAVPRPEPVPAGMVEIVERPSLQEWARKRRNPLIFAAVTLVVVATIGVQLRKRWLDELPRVAEIGRTEGLAKLDMGEFTVAKTLLAEAARAVNALGGQVEGADEIRQGAIEAALLADRCSEPLREVLERAETYNPPDAWASYFDAIYKGRSVIIQARVTSIPDPGRPDSRYDLDYRVYFGNAATPRGKARLDLTGFRLIESARPSVGDVLTFGARLASLRVDRIDAVTGERLIELVPDSGSFITRPRVTELIFPLEEPVEEAGR